MSQWPGAQQALQQGWCAKSACRKRLQVLHCCAPASCCLKHAGGHSSLPQPCSCLCLALVHKVTSCMALNVPFWVPFAVPGGQRAALKLC
jgi:hypothetical protein